MVDKIGCDIGDRPIFDPDIEYVSICVAIKVEMVIDFIAFSLLQAWRKEKGALQSYMYSFVSKLRAV